MITDTVEISRSPEEVFAYLDQLDRHREWQTQIVSAEVLTEGPPRVGTRVAETRKVGGREQRFTWELTVHEPPRRSAFRGIDGAVRPVGTVTIEPADDGASSRVRIDFDLEGYGLGKLFAPLARRHARKSIPEDQRRLKERLEAGA